MAASAEGWQSHHERTAAASGCQCARRVPGLPGRDQQGEKEEYYQYLIILKEL